MSGKWTIFHKKKLNIRSESEILTKIHSLQFIGNCLSEDYKKLPDKAEQFDNLQATTRCLSKIDALLWVLGKEDI